MTRQLLILAGGMGTRLLPLLGDLPKPMVQVGGKPVLEHQIELAKRYGFEDVLLLVGYRADKIQAYFNDGKRWGIGLRYHVESEPLGTAGAVFGAFDKLANCFVVMYGDTMLDVDLDRFWRFHQNKGSSATLAIHPNDHPHDSDLVEVGESDRIKAFHSPPHDPEKYHQNLVSAALYVMEKSSFAVWSGGLKKFDFVRELFPGMLHQGLPLFGYRTREYVKDMGTPERLAQVESDCQSGKIRSLSLTRLCPAAFLDRDGTLNLEVNRVKHPDQLRLLPGVGEAVRRLNTAGVLAVVITNQPVVARGDVSEDQLRVIHNKLEALLGEHGAYLDGIYWCPHHPHAGFPGERSELKIACECRKPGTALVSRAAAELGIDLSRSCLIGDSTTDIRTARNAGLRSIIVRTGHAGQDGLYPDRPDHECSNLTEAVAHLLRKQAFCLSDDYQ